MEEQEQAPLSHSICVYHAVSNAYDRKLPKVIAGTPHGGIDYEARLGNVHSQDGSKWNRYHKIVSPPLHDLSLYLDGNIGPVPKLDISAFMEMALTCRGKQHQIAICRHAARKCAYVEIEACVGKQHQIAICRHAARNCAYVEIEACVGRKKITSKEADLAHDKLKKIGLPRNFGLWECGILARRRVRDPVVERFYALWWHFTSQIVCRDQIWLPAVLYMMRKQLPSNFLNTLEMDVRKNDYFTFAPHS